MCWWRRGSWGRRAQRFAQSLAIAEKLAAANPGECGGAAGLVSEFEQAGGWCW